MRLGSVRRLGLYYDEIHKVGEIIVATGLVATAHVGTLVTGLYMGYQEAGGDLTGGPDPLIYVIPACAHIAAGSLSQMDKDVEEPTGHSERPIRDGIVGGIKGAYTAGVELAAAFGVGYFARHVNDITNLF